MSVGETGTTRRTVALTVGAITFVIAQGTLVVAQQRGTSATNPAERMRSNQTRIVERESIKSDMKASADPKRGTEELATLKQVGEDFTRIQTINNELTRQVAAGGGIDYKLIASRVAEINRRAARLKSNLVLPRLDESREQDASGRQKNHGTVGAEGMKAALLILGDRITSFTSNPYFTMPQVVDAKRLAAARRDLEAVIQLSKDIRKSAERLSKNSAIS
ncbi:MAG TPA: hypothetical protein VM866_02010 [Pyrinomonadaceae bacterium]|jgi:hypothetical protein|nr:hypothetical protein [Pyrinomonadaceae bacterium]